MSLPAHFDFEALDRWLSESMYQHYLALIMGRVGMTRRRAECFLRLWLYLVVKQSYVQGNSPQPPLASLSLPDGWVQCTCREAAEVFYSNQVRGSDRSAGMMLDKLAALGLLRKYFDGNHTQIELLALPELHPPTMTHQGATIQPDDFNPRCDAIPIANLLATNYNWLNQTVDATPYRIANILREWASHYHDGLRVLRRVDNQNPVGFYALYPTQRESEIRFFSPPSQGLHLSQVSTVDPFKMAIPGDRECRSVFVRSFVIDPVYRDRYQAAFVQDAQVVLANMQQEFPNLMDMYTLIIHPSYAKLAQMLGFQATGTDPKLPLQWMYQGVDRFLALDVKQALAQPLMNSQTPANQHQQGASAPLP